MSAPPIRPGTARRLGLRRPNTFATGGLVTARPTRGDEMTVLVDEGEAWVTPDMGRRYGSDFLAKLGGIRAENVHVAPDEEVLR